MNKKLVFLVCLTLISLPFQTKASTKNIPVSVTIPERREVSQLSTNKAENLTTERIEKNKHQSVRVTRGGEKIILETVTPK